MAYFGGHLFCKYGGRGWSELFSCFTALVSASPEARAYQARRDCTIECERERVCVSQTTKGIV